MDTKKSLIGRYLNYMSGQNGISKGVAATQCINYVVTVTQKMIEMGFFPTEILNNISIHLPPKGATMIDVDAINNSLNGRQMLQDGSMKIR